jgi:hypothetical protein
MLVAARCVTGSADRWATARQRSTDLQLTAEGAESRLQRALSGVVAMPVRLAVNGLIAPLPQNFAAGVPFTPS